MKTELTPWCFLEDRAEGSDSADFLGRFDLEGLWECLKEFPERNRLILEEIIMARRPHAEVAKEFGLSCERVRQISQEILRSLRHPSRVKRFVGDYDYR